MIEIYADGSAKNNGKENSCGGAGVCVMVQDKERKAGFRILKLKQLSEAGATNNQMELKALIYARFLATTEYAYDQGLIKSDSAYCVNMFNDWIEKWKSNGWTRGGNKPVENLELVKILYKYKENNYPNYRVERVPGHAGNLGNEIADALATNDQAKLDKIFLSNDINPIQITKFDIQ